MSRNKREGKFLGYSLVGYKLVGKGANEYWVKYRYYARGEQGARIIRDVRGAYANE